MNLTTPTTAEINDNIVAQLEVEFNQQIPLLPKAFLRVLAKVIAGLFILLYKYGGFIFLQLFVATASDIGTTINGRVITPLRQWGRLIGVGDPKPATTAELEITLHVISAVGSLPLGTQLIGAENNVTYIMLESLNLEAIGPVTTTVKAAADQAGGGGAGVIGNLPTGAVMAFANPNQNVRRDALVSKQTITGANAESTDSYRQRIVDRFQKRPQGGAYADYEVWSETVPGILNAYPYTGSPGQVDVYVEATAASSGSPDGIPTQAQLDAVKAYINFDENGLASRRPVNAYVNVLPIARLGFDVIVRGIQGVDDLVQVQAAITTAVVEYFADKEPFIAGVSVLPARDLISRIALSGLINDIVNVAGGIFTSATVTRNAAVVEVYRLGEGQKTKSGAVTFET